MRRLSLGLIRAYQVVLGPLLGGMCRFEPSCSRYAHEAISRFGFRRGWWLALRRLGRCRPFGGRGLDPVPEDYVTWREQRGAHHRSLGDGRSA